MLGDTGREWHINLSDGGKPYIIENGCMAMLEIKRPGGTNFNEMCAIRDNSTIVYDFMQNENTCIEAGIHDCNIVLYGTNEKVLATARFIMIGIERVIPRSDVVASASDQSKVDAWAVLEAQRQTNEEERKSAEEIRVSNEETRKSDEIDRGNKDALRESNEATRKANEETRVSNEEIRVAKDAERDTLIEEIKNCSLLEIKRENDAPLISFRVSETGKYYAFVKFNGVDTNENNSIHVIDAAWHGDDYEYVESLNVIININDTDYVFIPLDITHIPDGAVYVVFGGTEKEIHLFKETVLADVLSETFENTDRRFKELQSALGSYITDIDALLGGGVNDYGNSRQRKSQNSRVD
jgi:hypothetical protein